ncbi:MAG TPA: hypothetical protein PLD20_06705 [Blastocatellia bacterium]|nr:hypothetical protein [Blastocatellia bacterium]HMZ17598.1 hypothetical protein [Blastocatellia bacterium]
MCGVFSRFILYSSNAQIFALERARQADEFLDSIGVNVHLHYNDTAYKEYERIIKPRLRESGIRHLRDGIVLGRPDKEAMMRDLESFGFKFLMIADPRATSVEQAVAFVKRFSSVTMVEGPNEPDLNLSADWITAARSYQQQLFTEIKNDPGTKHVSVLAPSLALDNSFDVMGNIQSCVDYANLHNYYGGRNPGTAGWGDDGYGSISWQLRQARKVTSDKQVISSETGWHNYVGNPGGHRGTPESVVGKYLPRLYLEQFNRGIVRSYPYEFIDQHNDPYDLENNFGMLHADGSPKPAYTALKNLVALLRDDGAAFKTGSLTYSLNGYVDKLHHTLLQKRDGTFYLALWVEAYNWEPDAKVEYRPPPQQVILTVKSPVFGVAYCVPNDETTWHDVKVSYNNINLMVSDKVMLVKLKVAEQSLTSVSAASFKGTPLALDSLVTSFGTNLAPTTQINPSAQNVMTTLSGVRVMVRDITGTERPAPLALVSPAQLNYQIPDGTPEGEALVIVTRENQEVAAEQIRVARVAPGLFSVDGSGKGAAAGVALRVKPNGAQSYEPLAEYDSTLNRMTTRPLDLGPPGDRVYLMLSGTGLRHRSSLSGIHAMLAGITTLVGYAGPQNGAPGVDQLNLMIPRDLIGRGEVEVEIWVDGQRANIVKVNVK